MAESSPSRLRMRLYRKRKRAQGFCYWPGCWEPAVGLYCAAHSSSRNRQPQAKKKKKAGGGGR